MKKKSNNCKKQIKQFKHEFLVIYIYQHLCIFFFRLPLIVGTADSSSHERSSRIRILIFEKKIKYRTTLTLVKHNSDKHYIYEYKMRKERKKGTMRRCVYFSKGTNEQMYLQYSHSCIYLYRFQRKRNSPFIWLFTNTRTLIHLFHLTIRFFVVD